MNNLQEAYRAAMKGSSESHFKSGGVIGEIIRKAQDSTALLMQETALLIDNAAKAVWGSVAGDGKKPPVVDKLTSRMMHNIAEQKALPILRGPPIKNTVAQASRHHPHLYAPKRENCVGHHASKICVGMKLVRGNQDVCMDVLQ